MACNMPGINPAVMRRLANMSMRNVSEYSSDAQNVHVYQRSHCWCNIKSLLLISFALVLLIFSLPLHAEDGTAPGWILKGIEKYKTSDDEDQFEEAVRCFEKAVQIEPNYTPGLVWLGIAYMESAQSRERNSKTIDCFEKALSLPNPNDRFSKYTTTARQRLLRMRGHTRTIALCLDEGFTATYHDTGVKILERTRNLMTAKGFRVVNGDSIGYQNNKSQTDLVSSAQRANIGWIALVSVTKTKEAEWKESKKGGGLLGDILKNVGGNDAGGYWGDANVAVQVILLDCDLSRKLPQFQADSNSQTGKSSQEAFGNAINSCGDRIAKKFIDITNKEDELVKDIPGIRAVPTGVSMIFAETIVTDRQKARSLPVIVLPTPKDISGSNNLVYADTACLAAIQEMRKRLISSGQFAVIGPNELAKLTERRPSEWTPDKAMQFASEVGDRCCAVVLTQLTCCNASSTKDLLSSKISAEVTIKAIPVIKGQPTQSALVGTEKQSKTTGVLILQLAEDELQTLLIDVATTAAQKAVRQFQTAVAPATIAVLEFNAGRKVNRDMVTAIGSLQERMIKGLITRGKFSVL